MKKRPKLPENSKDYQLLQKLLPLFSQHLTIINNSIGFINYENTVYYFNGQMPIFFHFAEDLDSFKMFMAQLYILGTASQSEINQTFGLSPINMKRWVKKYKEEGGKAFFRHNVKKKVVPRVLTPEVLKKVQTILNAGNNPSEAANELGLKADTLRKAIKSGKLHVVNELKKKTRLKAAPKAVE